ncbi:bifunctional hydroxymethylpyrimidine kinase/phosphomethylpyrimidine kinase [Alkalibacillus haloalkaliphilus]|uniref:bifunctional hydroxymethylpyrimidine kinase/phosphomethylpyrimidine kinase n=1 Tax=Alkalibacillus haloalkaliphilus TaxID=94136 RepID=UPI0002F96914|nr:bifunctional hydroxymethylpyrimidine kinase/phosphomethylpyrimidine kinase [Alkalibacillus haloalkaliphilus]
MTVAKALTIAGSDSGGGAGIQADLKTFQELKTYGMSVLTAVTAQNTLGVQGVYPLTVSQVEEQLDSIGADLKPNALKTGMLFSAEIIETVAKKIQQYEMNNVVIDPVMIAKGGAKLLQDEAIDAMKKHLIPVATVVTPNIPEAEAITGLTLNSIDDRKEAAKRLYHLGAQNIIIKGGHGEEKEVIDLIYDGETFTQLINDRQYTENTHGTGCTFAAAIAAELAKDAGSLDAIRVAREFIQVAIEDGLHIGSGHGPTNHWAFQSRRAKV